MRERNGKTHAAVIPAKMLHVPSAGLLPTGVGLPVTVAAPADFPADYELTAAGDSDAALLERSTLAPVALNIGLGPPGSRVAMAVSLDRLLTAGLVMP